MNNNYWKALKRLRGKKEARILLVGLNGSGRQDLLYKLKLGTVTTTIPTIGFNVETLKCENISIISFDLDTGDKVRALWSRYFSNIAAVIFVIDALDQADLISASSAGAPLLSRDEFRHSSLLVFANNAYKPNAMSLAELEDNLGLRAIRRQNWLMQAAAFDTGDGIYEGLTWMTENMSFGNL